MGANRSFASTQTLGQMNADKAVATSPMPLPSGFLLSRLAEVPQMDSPAHTVNDAFQAPPQRWLVPGGLQTVMALAWLSFDKPARAVANACRALATETKRRTTVEDLAAAPTSLLRSFSGVCIGPVWN